MARAPSKCKNIKDLSESKENKDCEDEVFSTGTAKISSKKII